MPNTFTFNSTSDITAYNALSTTTNPTAYPDRIDSTQPVNITLGSFESESTVTINTTKSSIETNISGGYIKNVRIGGQGVNRKVNVNNVHFDTGQIVGSTSNGAVTNISNCIFDINSGFSPIGTAVVGEISDCIFNVYNSVVYLIAYMSTDKGGNVFNMFTSIPNHIYRDASRDTNTTVDVSPFELNIYIEEQVGDDFFILHDAGNGNIIDFKDMEIVNNNNIGLRLGIVGGSNTTAVVKNLTLRETIDTYSSETPVGNSAGTLTHTSISAENVKLYLKYKSNTSSAFRLGVSNKSMIRCGVDIEYTNDGSGISVFNGLTNTAITAGVVQECFIRLKWKNASSSSSNTVHGMRGNLTVDNTSVIIDVEQTTTSMNAVEVIPFKASSASGLIKCTNCYSETRIKTPNIENKFTSNSLKYFDDNNTMSVPVSNTANMYGCVWDESLFNSDKHSLEAKPTKHTNVSVYEVYGHTTDEMIYGNIFRDLNWDEDIWDLDVSGQLPVLRNNRSDCTPIELGIIIGGEVLLNINNNWIEAKAFILANGEWVGAEIMKQVGMAWV